MVNWARPPRWTGWPLRVAGDKGCGYPAIRALLEDRVIEQVIPRRSDRERYEGRRTLDRRVYKKRARVEQCVGWLKEDRRVGTRYDTLASCFLTFVNLAIIRGCLRILGPDDPSGRT
ncbi:MAG: transposase [Planctomycetes bacterium]|nr:transposase [Planctomycetota bacterium]